MHLFDPLALYDDGCEAALAATLARARGQAPAAAGDADLIALARGLLWDPRWPWHAAAALGRSVPAPKQYWRSPPRDATNALAGVTVGMR